MRENFFSASRTHASGVVGLVAAAFLVLSALVSPASAQSGKFYSLYGDYLAGSFALTARDNRAAAEYFRKALRKDPSNILILERAFVLELSTANMENAVRLAAQLVKIDTNHDLARVTLGVEALRARQFASARRHFSKGGEKGPIEKLTNALMLGWSHQGAGDLTAALEALKALEGNKWLNIYRIFNSALMSDASGDQKAAGAFYAEAYGLESSVLRFAESYARFLAITGKPDEARKVLAAYDKVSKDHPHIRAIQSDLDAGRTPDAIINNTDAGVAESLYEVGALLAREGGEDRAIVYLQLALYLDPNATMALLTLGDIYERQKNYELAAEIYSRVPESAPLHRSALIQSAHNLDAAKRLEEAKAVLGGLILANPKDIDAVRALADMMRGHEKFNDASELYTRAIATLDTVSEEDWSLFYYRGISYERTKRWAQAEADFKRALELKPDQPFVLNYLGYSWIDKGQNLEQAMTMIRKAVEARPDDGYIVDSLGWAHYRLGEYEAAVKELERAVELKPEDPVVNDHLGDAYWRADRRLEARFQWSHARDLKPEPDDLIKILEKLKNGLTSVEKNIVVVAAGGNQLNDATAIVPVKPQAAEPGPAPAQDMSQMVMPKEAPPLPDARPEPVATPEAKSVESKPAVRRHTVVRGDALWLLAKRYYGNGTNYERIIKANQGVIRPGNLIFPGQILVIPELE